MTLKTLNDFDVSRDNQIVQDELVRRHWDIRQEAIKEIKLIKTLENNPLDKAWEVILGIKIVYSEEAKQGIINYIKWKNNLTEEDLQ